MSPPNVVPIPHAIRDELTLMVVNDLLGPAGGPDEELDPREDRVTNRYLDIPTQDVVAGCGRATAADFRPAP